MPAPSRFARHSRCARRLTALLPLLLPAAHALSLTPVARVTVAGPAAPTALVALPDGSRVLCLGSRWVQLGGIGVGRMGATFGPCGGLSLSSSGKRLLSVTPSEFAVWNVSDGSKVTSQAAPDALGRVGFLNDDTVLVGTTAGVDSVNLATGTRQAVKQGGVSALLVAPDGKRAVISDGKMVQLVALPTFEILSATPCDTGCTVKNANFSPDGRTAAVLVGDTLIGLREGMPSNTVLRHVDAAVGLPQPDNTVLTFTKEGVESHDLQTGRREKVLLAGGVQPSAALQSGGRLLFFSDKGELLDTDSAGGDVRRLALPAALTGGGLSSSGAPYTLSAGGLSLDSKPVAGNFWGVQTANKSTWALRSAGDGGLQVGLLSAEKFAPLPSLRTATHLSVNFWGNHAAVWDNETLNVVSQPKNKVIASLKLPLKGAEVTLSPDAARAYVIAGDPKAESFVVTLANGKRFPLPYTLAGGRPTGIQISGKGVVALAATRDNVTLYRPNEKQSFASLEGRGEQARFSPDSKWLALPFYNRVDIVNAETGRVEASTPPLADLPSFVAWSADSKKLAVGASLLNELRSVTMFELK
ncbi:hypothetical protein [Deinococcus xinjiangensis]|uniref:hypothetical protein n=1 Tax=Deinococcus xinjiangensis TaxID=457454 RepID=UPI00336567AF